MPEAPDRRRRVLVVDDDAPNRALLEAFLEREHHVLQASTGPEALDVCGREPVDLVLLDVVLPGLGGFEVCRALKARAERYLPVILLTGLADQEHRNAGLEAGADDFLGKPYDRRELLLRVRAFLRIREQEARIREQEERLRAQLDALSQLQALKDELFALVVHDVRNPLTGALGYVDLLLTEVTRRGDERLARWAEKALEGARKVEEVLASVLEVQLLESGSVPVRRTRTTLRPIVEDAVSSLGGVAAGNSVQLNVQAEHDAAIEADARLLRRAIENLLANALKYSPPRGAVDIAIRRADRWIELTVSDRGPGIPDHLKEVLFQKFGSVEARSGQARRGHGLGLHLVKLVASAHGGSSGLSDREGGGTTFTLRLPTAGAS